MTGASGFIGRHVVAALQRSYRVHALARRTPAEARARGLDGPLIEAITGTFRMGIDQLYDSLEALTGGFVPLEPPG